MLGSEERLEYTLVGDTVNLSQRLLAADNHFRNQNSSSLELDNGRDRQLAYRADATSAITPSLELGAGAQAERRDNSRVRRFQAKRAAMKDFHWR